MYVYGYMYACTYVLYVLPASYIINNQYKLYIAAISLGKLTYVHIYVRRWFSFILSIHI